jgi:hypothetical protein
VPVSGGVSSVVARSSPADGRRGKRARPVSLSAGGHVGPFAASGLRVRVR